ncbi:MAG TPA: sigma-70 family RNA polymerase sigma factor [Streptosporangiaceae bacterium]|nr:sigma-70 family RNA polymerase sigma factor [Streptosporangiaceae bacterium]
MEDGDLVRRARTGDTAAFRLLVERHQAPARTRAARLCARPDDVDDVLQEAFLQAFVALDRLRDPDRFGAWLAGIVRNVQRAAARRAPEVLLADWPEALQPASAHGLPSAEDLDRAEALGAAVAALPAGQRRAVELYYFADRPAAHIAGSPGAAKASLHKARRRLRQHITAHRPDLIPAMSRRTAMTAVRIAHAEPHFDTRLDGSVAIRHILVVLADDPGHRAMGLWLRTRHGMALWRVLEHQSAGGGPGRPSLSPMAGYLQVRESSAEDLAIRLLAAAGSTVTGVDIDEVGPNLLAAQVGLSSPAGRQQVAADPGSALALAVTLDVPVRVAGALMDRLAVPVSGDDLLGPFLSRIPARPSGPRSAPQNLAFADSLDGWTVGGSARAEVTGAHWDDYAVTTAGGTATLSASVPDPYGSVFLGQEFLADEYRGTAVTLRAEVRGADLADHAELSVHVVTLGEEPGQDGPPGHGPVRRVRRDGERQGKTITGSQGWTSYELTVPVPADAEHMGFDLTLTGAGQAGLRNVSLHSGG